MKCNEAEIAGRLLSEKSKLSTGNIKEHTDLYNTGAGTVVQRSGMRKGQCPHKKMVPYALPIVALYIPHILCARRANILVGRSI